jgi:hypothetical protein
MKSNAFKLTPFCLEWGWGAKKGGVMKSNKYLSAKKFLLLIFLLISLSSYSHANNLDNWSIVTSGTDNWFNGIAYCPGCSGGNGAFVTVGNFGKILISPDGIGWTSQTTDYGHLLGIGYVNGTFVALGKVGTILTSTDGAIWTLRNQGTAHPLSYDLFGVTYGNGKYVVVGAHGTILTSSGAPNWLWTKINFLPSDSWLYSIAYNSSPGFVTVGNYDSVNFTPTYSEILYSTNGTSWISRDSGTTKHLRAVAYGGGKFVAVGDAGVVLSSTNGTSWIIEMPADPYNNYNLYGVAYGAIDGNNYFVAVGEAGTILYANENNLGLWSTPQSSETDTTPYDLEAVAYDSYHGVFAAVGGHGTILLDGDTVFDTISPLTTVSPAGGTYASVQSVTLSCNDGAGVGCDNIYYTTNGSTPTSSSSVYSNHLYFSATTTLKFFARDLAGNSESVKTATYILSDQGEPNGKPDLVISLLTIPSTAGAGSSLSVSFTTKNNGPGNAPPSTTNLYLSKDSNLGGGDTLLGSISVAALAAGAGSNDTVNVTIPGDTVSGTYYIIAKADAPQVITEIKETNNIRSKSIKVGADLVISLLTIPSTAGAGSSLSVSFTTKNNGPGSAPASTTSLYLSSDATLGGDTLLGSISVPDLAAGADNSSTVTVTIPYTAGTKYIIAKADAPLAVTETRETNNQIVKRIKITE